MVFERPKRFGGKKSPATERGGRATQRPGRPQSNRRSDRGGGGQGSGRGGSRRNGGGSDNRPPEPSPWLIEPTIDPSGSASFVEYLRWMRSPDTEEKDSTKVQILQMAMQNANYSKLLTQRTECTRQIAGAKNCFEVTCSWRIRVGGQRGPESILLPTFDAVGMPYIPSATLRGVARTQAIREFMEEDDCDWKQAEEKIAPWFGSLDEKGCDRTGKVIFFDAYPLPGSGSATGNMAQDKNQNGGGLMMDMANNIWKWDGNQLEYKSNPNPFLSLHESTFVIGLRPMNASVTDDVMQRVKQWLIAGLAKGIGSQVNTGYGLLGTTDDGDKPFLQVPFTLSGQLTHGYQKVQWKWKKGEWKPDNFSREEVRPIVLKSMMRYWFRAFARGVLPVGSERQVEDYLKAVKKGKDIQLPATVRALEAVLFGSITPQCQGWLTVRAEGETIQSSPFRSGALCGKQIGNFAILLSSSTPQRQAQAVKELCKPLVWLLFHLGGLGQGARRPCYSRDTRPHAPWYRGATVVPEVPESYCEQYGSILIADEDDSFWALPNNITEFKSIFQQRLREFYAALKKIVTVTAVPKIVKDIRESHEWVEAVDQLCKIMVVKELDGDRKPTALKVLHQQFHELENRGDLYNAKNLCGHTKKDKIPPLGRNKGIITKADKKRQLDRKAIPSPVWISDLKGKYQVVTVFGASQDPRKQFLKNLEDELSSRHVAQIWPMDLEQ